MLEIRGRKTFWSVKFENMLRLNLQDISRVSIILGTWPVEFLQFNLFNSLKISVVQDFESIEDPRQTFAYLGSFDRNFELVRSSKMSALIRKFGTCWD